MPSGLTNKKAMMWVVNWGRGGGFPGGNVRWAYGYRCALTVGSWSPDRQSVFNVEKEYPPVSVS